MPRRTRARFAHLGRCRLLTLSSFSFHPSALASSSRRYSGAVRSSRRSISPGGGASASASAFASAFASSSSSFTAPSTTTFFADHHYQHSRATSPTRVNLYGASPPHAPAVRFSFVRSASPGRALSAADKRSASAVSFPVRRTCLCSPTKHPGSFRCGLHKGNQLQAAAAFSSPLNRLNARRSAMKNSLVRIGAVEGDWVKRALSALIRPSSHQQRRRDDFQPRPSRLSRMSKAGDL